MKNENKQTAFLIIGYAIACAVLIIFVKEVRADFTGITETHQIPLAGTGLGATQKTGIHFKVTTGVSINTIYYGTTSNQANVIYLYTATSGGYALGTLVATTSASTTGRSSPTNWPSLGTIGLSSATGDYYFLVFDKSGAAYDPLIYTTTSDHNLPEQDNYIWWEAGWNSTRVPSSLYNVTSISFGFAAGEFKYNPFSPSGGSLDSQAEAYCNDIAGTSSANIFGLDFTYGLCRLGAFFFMPSANSLDYITDNFLIAENVFPFSLVFDVTNILRETSVTQKTFSLPLPAPIFGSTSVTILSSTSMTSFVGSSNVSFIRTTISYLLWVLAAVAMIAIIKT